MLGSFQLSIIQIAAFPLLLFLVWKVRVFSRGVPRGVLLFSIIGALTATTMAYTYHGDHAKSFLVAQLERDEFGTDSRILREMISQAIPGSSGVAPRRLLEEIKESREAERRFGDASPLVWGNRRWLVVSVPRAIQTEQVRELHQTVEQLLHLQIVDAVSLFGLSFEPERATAHFIGAFFSGFLDESYARLGPVERELQREISLREAASIGGTWSSFSHRAFPLWTLGNRHFQRAIADGRYERGEMDCAVRAYKDARGYLRFGDNPDLAAAIFNNHALALLVRAWHEGHPRFKKEARSLLRLAMKTLRQPNIYKTPYVAAQIARQNLHSIEGSGHGRGKLKVEGKKKHGKGKPGKKRKKKRGKGHGKR